MAEGKVVLNVENFIHEIKAMSERECSKLRATDLIDLIIQVPDLPSKEARYEELSSKVEGLIAAIQILDSRSVSNAAHIINLEANNKITLNQNNEMKFELINFKTELNSCNEHVNNIEQYLRINNIEIVGLTTEENDNEDDVILEVLNNLEDIIITSGDIDISHAIRSKRGDGKTVHVVKFLSRKANIASMNAKKQSYDFKYKGNVIYINEHLSPNNRRLFPAASIQKRELDYKFLWTRNGYVYFRKNDNSQIIFINNDEALNNLT